MSQRQTTRLWLWLILTLAATAFILYNALQNSTDSTASSDAVIAWLAPLLEALDRWLGGADWHFWVRKAAHVTEYALLGASALSLAKQIAARVGRPFTAHAALYALLVAVTDEFLQGFMARTSAVYDIWIDFGGVLLGFGAVAMVACCRRIGKQRGESL